MVPPLLLRHGSIEMRQCTLYRCRIVLYVHSLTSRSVNDRTISRNAACSSVGLNNLVNEDPLPSSFHDEE